MSDLNKRRSFLKSIAVGGAGAALAPTSLLQAASTPPQKKASTATEIPAAKRKYNTPYTGEYLHRLAFPVGGIGAGMFCMEGTGAISHMSVRNQPGDL